MVFYIHLSIHNIVDIDAFISLKKMQISIQMINVDEHYFNYFNFIIDDWWTPMRLMQGQCYKKHQAI